MGVTLPFWWIIFGWFFKTLRADLQHRFIGFQFGQLRKEYLFWNQISHRIWASLKLNFGFSELDLGEFKLLAFRSSDHRSRKMIKFSCKWFQNSFLIATRESHLWFELNILTIFFDLQCWKILTFYGDHVIANTCNGWNLNSPTIYSAHFRDICIH